MSQNQRLISVFERIKLIDAPEQRIDLNDPAHRFTLWAGGFCEGFNKWCASEATLDDAWRLAASHIYLKELYIVKGPLDSLGIIDVREGLPVATKAP